MQDLIEQTVAIKRFSFFNNQIKDVPQKIDGLCFCKQNREALYRDRLWSEWHNFNSELFK